MLHAVLRLLLREFDPVGTCAVAKAPFKEVIWVVDGVLLKELLLTMVPKKEVSAQTILAVPSVETLHTPYLDTLDLSGEVRL